MTFPPQILVKKLTCPSSVGKNLDDKNFELVKIVKNYFLPFGEVEDFVQKLIIF